MSIGTREVDVRTDRQRLLPFLTEHLAAHGDPRYFDWLYLDNPWGVGRAWVAHPEGSDEIVGMAAAFPRMMQVGGEEMLAWNLGDFAISPEYRSLGPAVQLQRQCLKDVLSGEVAFAYDHPSCNMMAVYRWLKIETTGEVVRYAKPLRVDAQVEKFIPKGVVSRGVSGFGNILLSLADTRRTGNSDLEVSRLSGPFDERFTQLNRVVTSKPGVVGVRTADYLNWRYLDNPHAEHEVITVTEDDSLRGYAVVRRDDDVATITDLVDDGASIVLDAALAGVVDSMKRQGVRTLSAPVLESSPLIPTLERWGFQPREARIFVVSTQADGPFAGTVNRADNWYLVDGDRDV